MFYETAQTVGPGWHRSFKPSHYEDMTWSPSTRHFRSPGSSPETYRRITPESDFPDRTKAYEDEFFSGRRSPSFPRRIFKEWNDSPSSNHRFSERPRMFKRVFKPSHWDEDIEFDRDVPNLRRVEREFDNFDDSRPSSRRFDDDFSKRFRDHDLGKDIEEEFQKAEGRVHHIPIMVESRMEDLKSRFGKNSPPPDRNNEEDYSDEWVGPQVQRLRKNFEPENSGLSSRFGNHRHPRDSHAKQRAFQNTIPETWDPHAVHTLPTRKVHKSSQSFDDSRHPVPPKSVFRSYSETHEDVPRPSQQHSAAFRSHSDGHCPNQTYVTKIEVNLPSEKEREDLRAKYSQRRNDTFDEQDRKRAEDATHVSKNQENEANETLGYAPEATQSSKPKGRNKFDSPALQQIAVVLQNVEDLIVRVESYNGTGRDKQFRFLDEMLTRCMLRLDDVDTEGREDVRNARKAAVKEVQSCIDKLEAKADQRESQRQHSNSSQHTESENNDQTNVNTQKCIPLPPPEHLMPKSSNIEKSDDEGKSDNEKSEKNSPDETPKSSSEENEGNEEKVTSGEKETAQSGDNEQTKL
ncbi:BAG domain-containing protein Samui-like [Uloborus diversus]|uniref:BAG domain-containing protein Samui-like n=1 Tax=Uloborus diversus TaxID=327109 RepID=UPI00240A1925|nr:BAG domain-containing protein Samui-like [Uloborus diversus]